MEITPKLHEWVRGWDVYFAPENRDLNNFSFKESRNTLWNFKQNWKKIRNKTRKKGGNVDKCLPNSVWSHEAPSENLINDIVVMVLSTNVWTITTSRIAPCLLAVNEISNFYYTLPVICIDYYCVVKLSLTESITIVALDQSKIWGFFLTNALSYNDVGDYSCPQILSFIICELLELPGKDNEWFPVAFSMALNTEMSSETACHPWPEESVYPFI